MTTKIKELINIYFEKQNIIELERKHVIADLKYQAEEQIIRAFAENVDEPFEVYDEFFKNLYADTCKIQNEVNEEIAHRLEAEKTLFIERLEELLAKENNEKIGNEIVDEVMDSAVHQVDKLINKDANPIVEDLVSTMDLEALLKEIKNDI